ncbi:MAG: RidA family protein [Candidatus Hodarchaeota archaeon]
MSKKEISSDNAPKAIGPYSQGIQVGNFIFLSGQIAIDPNTGQVVEGAIEEQTKQVMGNLQSILQDLGISINHIVKTTVFLRNLQDFSKFNETYQMFFEPPYPARSTVEVSNLPRGVLIEVEAIAVHDLK